MYNLQLDSAYFPAQSDMDAIDLPIGEGLRDVTARNINKLALTEVCQDGSRGRSWTYGELWEDCQRLAFALSSRFAKGEKIVVWSPNSPEWVLMEYACALAGLVLVTANPSLQVKELRYVLEQSGAVALFHVQEFRGNPMAQIANLASSGNNALREVTDLDDHDVLFALGSNEAVLPEVSTSDPAQIQYTSGTTGYPKAALLSHGGLLNNARFYADRCGVTENSIWINMMQMFHTSGCGMVTLGAMQAGAHMVLVSLFDAPRIVDLVESEKADIILGVPTMVVALLEEQEGQPRNTSALRLISCGGANVAADLVRRVKKAFGCGFSTLYGQTEHCPVITQHHLDDSIDDICTTIGQPIPQTEVSIRRLTDNSGADLDEPGEICARGPCTMLEYHDNPAATFETIDSEGWLHTGDLGTMDARGYLKITGRVKEMIIRGGENHFPAEIENAMLMHPQIQEVAVVGIADEKWGELIACFIRTSDDKRLSVAALKSHCRTELSPQKTPNLWIQVNSFPMTGSGKIQKFALRDMFERGEFTPLTA
ncbi:MAG: AMP-binding protein [Rhizobiaceae bacterium]